MSYSLPEELGKIGFQLSFAKPSVAEKLYFPMERPIYTVKVLQKNTGWYSES